MYFRDQIQRGSRGLLTCLLAFTALTLYAAEPVERIVELRGGDRLRLQLHSPCCHKQTEKIRRALNTGLWYPEVVPIDGCAANEPRATNGSPAKTRFGVDSRNH